LFLADILPCIRPSTTTVYRGHSWSW